MGSKTGIEWTDKSTGKREAQKKREDLLWGELKLGRVYLHLCNALAAAARYDAIEDQRGYVAAAVIVRRILSDVKAEAEALR